MNNDYDNSYKNKRFVNSMIFRVLALLILLGLISIPVYLVDKKFDQHINQQQDVVDQLSNQWGNEQTIIGPILSIPFVERISRIESQTGSDGVKSSVSKDIFNNKTLMLLPENLRINANLKDKVLAKQSILSHVYEGEVDISGNFNLDKLPEASGYNTIEWDKTFIAIGLTDNKSVEASSPLRWEGSSAVFKPGTQLPKLIKHGLHASLEDVANDNALPQFKIKLKLKGTQSFKFAPLGELTSATLTSDLPQTKVQGDISESSKVRTENSFEAIWLIPNLVRSYPQQWLIEGDNESTHEYHFASVLAGVESLPTAQPSNQSLLKIQSTLPFLVPMLGILFLSIVMLEFKRNTRSKPKFLHYLVISIVVLMTPVLLLTLKSITSFEQTYQIVAGSSIILIMLYLMSALKSFGKAFYILLVLVSLYAALYVKLQMPEYTLVALSAAGLFITVLLMIASINIYEDE